MPEVAVNEDRRASQWKDAVSLPADAANWPSVDEVAHPSPMTLAAKSQFRKGIAPRMAAHSLMDAERRCEYARSRASHLARLGRQQPLGDPPCQKLRNCIAQLGLDGRSRATHELAGKDEQALHLWNPMVNIGCLGGGSFWLRAGTRSRDLRVMGPPSHLVDHDVLQAVRVLLASSTLNQDGPSRGCTSPTSSSCFAGSSAGRHCDHLMKKTFAPAMRVDWLTRLVRMVVTGGRHFGSCGGVQGVNVGQEGQCDCLLGMTDHPRSCQRSASGRDLCEVC
jgi:hypothetical protein